MVSAGAIGSAVDPQSGQNSALNVIYSLSNLLSPVELLSMCDAKPTSIDRDVI